MNLIYDFSNREFPDLRPEKCSYVEYNPSEISTVHSADCITFVILVDGKAVITTSEHRKTLTRESGFVIPSGNSARIKADSIESATAIILNVCGRSLERLYKLIEKRSDNLIPVFESSGICDAARDLVSECSAEYSSDYGIMLSFYGFLNSIYEYYSEKKLSTQNTYMKRAVEYIERNYNKNISVEGIANMLGIERSYLSRLFKSYKNKSTQNYIIDYRIRCACRMFEQEDVNVSQVCAAVGYTNIYCFSRIFKSRVGVPPKEYMERCRKTNV